MKSQEQDTFRSVQQAALGIADQKDNEALVEQSRARFHVELNWKRKLSLFLSLIFTVCTFLPTNLLYESRALGLALSTLPLVLVWVGDWLSEEDESTHMATGSLVKGMIGKLLMFLGWIVFARLFGRMVLLPLIMWI